jgi:hypothetical protein
VKSLSKGLKKPFSSLIRPFCYHFHVFFPMQCCPSAEKITGTQIPVSKMGEGFSKSDEEEI